MNPFPDPQPSEEEYGSAPSLSSATDYSPPAMYPEEINFEYPDPYEYFDDAPDNSEIDTAANYTSDAGTDAGGFTDNGDGTMTDEFGDIYTVGGQYVGNDYSTEIAYVDDNGQAVAVDGTVIESNVSTDNGYANEAAYVDDSGNVIAVDGSVLVMADPTNTDFSQEAAYVDENGNVIAVDGSVIETATNAPGTPATDYSMEAGYIDSNGDVVAVDGTVILRSGSTNAAEAAYIDNNGNVIAVDGSVIYNGTTGTNELAASGIIVNADGSTVDTNTGDVYDKDGNYLGNSVIVPTSGVQRPRSVTAPVTPATSARPNAAAAASGGSPAGGSSGASGGSSGGSSSGTAAKANNPTTSNTTGTTAARTVVSDKRVGNNRVIAYSDGTVTTLYDYYGTGATTVGNSAVNSPVGVTTTGKTIPTSNVAGAPANTIGSVLGTIAGNLIGTGAGSGLPQPVTPTNRATQGNAYSPAVRGVSSPATGSSNAVTTTKKTAAGTSATTNTAKTAASTSGVTDAVAPLALGALALFALLN